MSDGTRGRIARRVAFAVGAVAVARVLLHALLDRRPRFGGSEANDLVHLVRHHWHLRGYEVGELGVGLLEDRYKPPLYYGGLPLLMGGQETLSYAPLLAVNALALALALVGAWVLARRVGGPRAGAWAVVVLAALPAVAGRFTFVGVEPLHLALLLWTLVGLLALRDPERGLRTALWTGAVLAVAMLIKWTFAVAAIGPVVIEAVTAVRTGDRRRSGLIGVAAAVGAVPVLAWLVWIGGPATILAGASEDPTTAQIVGGPVWLFLPRWAVVQGLGVGGLAALWLASWGWNRDGELRAASIGWLLGAPVLALGVAHQVIPHKEVRYLLPAFGPAAIAIGLGLARLDAAGGGHRLAVRAVGALLVLGTLGVPQFKASVLGSEQPAGTRLRLSVDVDDRGVAAVVSHPSLQAESRPVVLTSFVGERWIELQDLWTWELYGRGGSPVVVLPSQKDLRWDHARREIERASHLLTNRDFNNEEVEIVAAAGFVPVLEADIGVPGSERIQLWSRRAR